MPAESIDWVALRLLAMRPASNLKFIQHTDWPDRLKDSNCLIEQLELFNESQFAVRQIKSLYDHADKHLNVIKNIDCDVICIEDSRYPQLLKSIYDPPVVLFSKGNVQALSDPQVAIVGGRKSSSLARATAQRFAQELTQSGVHVTSGLAIGIDHAAHLGAIQAGPGTTIAVMANGPDLVYPQRHQRLAQQILDSGGLLVTEQLPGVQPRPYLFPERNRIISGMSLGTLVVEAAIKSGSLVTARSALEQGREVFAIPGAITNELARGCHHLIKEGAQLVETVSDIVASLYLPLSKDRVDNPPIESDDPIIYALHQQSLTADQLAAKLTIPIGQLQRLLVELEISGIIGREGARYVVLR
jgi:DNA processing protein